jgi:hypothetical protein
MLLLRLFFVTWLILSAFATTLEPPLVGLLRVERDPLSSHFELSWVVSGMQECAGAIILVWDNAVFYSSILGPKLCGAYRYPVKWDSIPDASIGLHELRLFFPSLHNASTVVHVNVRDDLSISLGPDHFTLGGIPRIIHRIWLADDAPIPTLYEAYWNSWRTKHPGWSMVTWTSSNLVEFVRLLPNRDLLLRAESFAELSDVARVDILREFGGLYVDTDFECLRSFENTIHEALFVYGEEEDGVVCPSLFASTPSHPILRLLSQELRGWHAAHAGYLPNIRSGPHFWSKVISSVASAGACESLGCLKLTPNMVYPYSWRDLPPHSSKALDLTKEWGPDVLAVHHWSQSWKKDRKPIAHVLSEL